MEQIKSVIRDLEMLADGSWFPDEHSLRDSIAMLEEALALIDKSKEEKTEYFLFGSGPCKVMSDDGFDAVVEYIKSDDCDSYELYKFVPSETNSAGTLLESFDGYMDFRGITKEQYEILVAI